MANWVAWRLLEQRSGQTVQLDVVATSVWCYILRRPERGAGPGTPLMPVIIPNPPALKPPEAPRKPDGSLYLFEMIFDDGRHRAYDDSARELLNLVIDDYPEEEDAARRVREAHAVAVQVEIQPILTFEDVEVLDNLAPADREVLNSSRDVQPRIERWDVPIKLLLIDTGYEPYTDVPLPIDGRANDEQQIFWLRPADEEEYLISLGLSGWVLLAHLP
ncbi:MAG: hypothetical protein ACYDBS_07695 [Acidimicrobiales bacterium]